MQYKLKHRLSAALMAGAMCCTMIPAASAEEISTPEIADTFVPEITDSVTPDLSQITENLYNDLPDAPTGSYLGSMGLPVATGETKISIWAWVQQQKLYFRKGWRFSATHLLMQTSFLPMMPSKPKSYIRLTPSNLRLQQAFM